MLDADLTYYGFRVISVNQEADEFSAPAGSMCSTTLTLKSPTTAPEVRAKQLLSDLTVMAKVRESNDPAVREAYEQMLTVMALTKGRIVTDENGVSTTR